MHLDLHHTLTYTSNLTVYRLRTKLFDKRYYLSFFIVNFPFINMLQHFNIVVPIMNT